MKRTALFGSSALLQGRSEELEAEADAIRVRLGIPAAIGRPPKGGWLGWAVLTVAIAVIIVGVALLTR